MRLSAFTPTNENFEEPEVNTEVSPEEEVVAPVDAAEGQTEMEESQDQIDTLDEGLEEGEVGVDTLTEVQQVMVEGGEDAPISDTEIQAVQATHESIMFNLGIDMVFPTMERMEPTTRRSQLIATLESDKKGILTRMVDAIKAAGSALMNFIKGLIRNNWVLKKYLEYVRKKVTAIPNSAKPKEDKMSKSASAMSISGTAGMSSVPAMEETALGLIRVSNVLVDKVNSMNFKLKDEHTMNIDTDGIVSPKTVPMRGQDDVIGYLTGDRAFSHDSSAWIFGHSGAYKNTRSEYTPKVAEEVAVASKQDMVKLLGSAEQIINNLKSFDAKHSKIKTIVSTLINYAAGVLTFYPSIVSKSAEKAFRNQASLMAVRIILSKGLSRLPLEAWKTAKAFIDYANNSAKQYKGVDGSNEQSEPEDNTVHKANWEVA